MIDLIKIDCAWVMIRCSKLCWAESIFTGMVGFLELRLPVTDYLRDTRGKGGTFSCFTSEIHLISQYCDYPRSSKTSMYFV